MASFSNNPRLSAPQSGTFDGERVFDRVALGRSTNGTYSSGHEPKIVSVPGLREAKDKGSPKKVAPVFQPSAESLSIFDEAKKECKRGGRTRRGLCGWSELRGQIEGARDQSKNHAPGFESSAESLAIFDEAKKQCDEGQRLSKRFGVLGANDAHPIRSFLEDSRSRVTNRVTTDPLASLPGDQSSIDVPVEEGLKSEAKDKTKDTGHDGSFDAAAWCAKVRQHQGQAYYLKSDNRRAYLEAKRRSRQPFTPWERYRSPPRQSVASACWESWRLDEKTAATIREELRKRTSQEKNEPNSPGQFVKRLASTCRHLSRRMFSWFSLTTNKLWSGVCNIAKRIVGLEIYVTFVPSLLKTMIKDMISL